MPYIHFHGQDKKVEMSPDMLESFTDVLPSDKKYADLALAIAQMGNPSLTATILEKGILPKEYLGILWNDGDSEFRVRFSKQFELAEKNFKKLENEAMASGSTTHESQRNPSAELERDHHAVEALSAIVLHEFPKEKDFELFKENYLPKRYQENPSLGIGSIESLFYLLAWKFVRLRHEQEQTYTLQTKFGLQEKVSLMLDVKEFEFNLELLTLFADYCVSDEEECTQMVCALFGTKEPLIMSRVIWTGLWPRDEGDNAWKMGSYPLCYELIEQSFSFVHHLNDEQALDIIKLNDEGMLCALAKHLRCFFDPEDYYSVRRRISTTMLENLIRFIATSTYPSVIKYLRYIDPGSPEKYQDVLNSANTPDSKRS